MSFLKNIFGGRNNVPKADFKVVLDSNDEDGIIIQLSAYILLLCNYGDKMERLSGPQKVFYFNYELEREINNGGFHQYFFNSGGNFAHETVLSLKEIGAGKTAGILQLAVNQFPNAQVPKDRNERQDILQQIEGDADKVFEELDNQFYAYPDNLHALTIAYVRSNKASFISKL